MELIENFLQLLVTFLGACLAGFAYWKSRRQQYFLLLCFYGCFALGALYWTLYLLLFATTPQVFYVSEFGWVASVIFLRILQATLFRPEERNRILHLCMDGLNPDYREVLYLTYFEGMSYAQAAEVTGKTVKQITNMVYRGKESLRKLLEQEGITNAEP